MKKITHLILYITLLISSFYTLQAQNGYTFTLLDNSNFSYTIAAVSNYDSGSFSPITESYGFVIVLPDGITFTETEALPTGTSTIITPIQGTDVSGIDPDFSDNDLFLITAQTNAATLPAHLDNVEIPLITIQINETPSTGEISLLSNDSVLANGIGGGALDNFIQVDTVDDGMVSFTNGVVGASGLSGTTLFDFSTLSTTDAIFESKISIYPNPVSDIITIEAPVEIEKIEIYNLLGKKVMTVTDTMKINMNQFSSGIYLFKLFSEERITTKRVIVR